MKYKVGTLVRIIDDTCDHQLPIGSTHVIEEIGEFIGDEFYVIETMAVTDADCESVGMYLTYRSYNEGGVIICLTDTVEEAIDVLCKDRDQTEYERYEHPEYTEIRFKVPTRNTFIYYVVQPIDKNVPLNIDIGQ